MEILFNDVRYTFRIMRKSPGFTLIIILTLALAIGANTAIFSIVNGVLLRPLPFSNPQQLVSIGEFDARDTPAIPDGGVSYPDFADIRARNHSFTEVAAYQDDEYTLTGIGQSLRVNAENVSTNLFHLLDSQPSLGRSFLSSEDEPGHLVVILGNAFWRRHFNSDLGAIGRAVNLNGRGF